MMNYLERYFIARYLNKNREIVKVTSMDDIRLHLMGTPLDVVKLLKRYATSGTLSYYEATTDQDRWIAKGMILLSRLLRERHQQALSINDWPDEKKEKEWKKFVKN